MSEFTSILKPNATGHDRAIEQAIRKGKPDLTPIATLMNPDTCPAGLLGWLAWSFSVDVWDPAWSEQTRRDVIRHSIAIHRVKGTRGAMRRALSTLGFRTDISEWFEHGGAPHTFRLDAYADEVFAAGFQIDARLLDTVTRLIGNVKPVRSHFTLRIGESLENDAYLRAGLRQAHLHRLDLDPAPRAHVAGATIHARAAHRARRIDTHEHVPAARMSRTGNVTFARVGLRRRMTSRITHEFQPREGAAYAIERN